MQDISNKNDGELLTADEWNEGQRELVNLLTASGVTPSSGDLFQVAKSLPALAGSADFYTATADGSGNLTLGSAAPFAGLFVLRDGLRLRFYTTAAAATSLSPTLTIGAFTKPLRTPSGGALQTGAYGAGIYTEVVYDAPNDRFKTLTGADGAGLGPVITATRGNLESTASFANTGRRVLTLENYRAVRKRRVDTVGTLLPSTVGGATLVPLDDLVVTLDKASTGEAHYRVRYEFVTQDAAGAAASPLLIYADYGTVVGSAAYVYASRVTMATTSGAATDAIVHTRTQISSPASGPFSQLIYSSEDTAGYRHWVIELLARATGGALTLRVQNGAASDGSVLAGASVIAEVMSA